MKLDGKTQLVRPVKRNTVVTIVIGDWSKDGHEVSEEFDFKINCTNEELQQAFLDSIKLTDIDLSNECAEYREYKFSEACVKKLSGMGYDFSKKFDAYDDTGTTYCGQPEGFADLIMWFCKLSLPKLKYSQQRTKKVFFNGYWNKNKQLNTGFGYGLFGN